MCHSTSWEIPLSEISIKGGRSGPENSPISWASRSSYQLPLNYLYSKNYTNIPIFDHTLFCGRNSQFILVHSTILQISYMYYNIHDGAGLPKIGLEKIYCCVPCKCAFYRLVQTLNSKLFPHHNSSQFTEFPSPAQRVACRWNHNCRSTNLKKFRKIEQVAAPGPRASRSSACPFSKRVGQKLAPAPYPALVPPSQFPSKFIFS